MSKDKLLMFSVIIGSILCTIWAFTIPSYGMAAVLILNALFSLWVLLFKLNKEEK